GAGGDLHLDIAALARLRVAESECALRAVEGFFEGDLDGLLDVGAFARRGAYACTTARGSAEQLLEEAAQVLRLESTATWASSGPGVVASARSWAPTVVVDLFPVVAPAVVLLALLRIGEDGVGFADFLEQLLGVFVAGV